LPIRPADLFEQPPFAQVGGYNSVFALVTRWYELVEEPEEFVDLRFGKIGVVGGVFDFKSVEVGSFARHYVGQRVEAGVANWDAYGIVAFFVEQFN
jgi:hypothetical protein